MENCKIRTLYNILNDMKYEAYKKNPQNIENLRKQSFIPIYNELLKENNPKQSYKELLDTMYSVTENLQLLSETDKNEVYHKTRYLMIKIHYLLPRDF